eukprot:CAMPEP_0198459172 /NCGR_PEP_ID=MMETSP1453-20131121/39470_1 /TAXON_ID=1461543 ORGANISM="Unidentified sp., Strain RCC701" /NCGR_SAMPLE_ID=MMETSP1453 /ASSEMBLY_ACC=CAM_ASM_001118 /LENGTH=106 /DNA_ID=CAMNT_0044184117 /DNA_START=230 /DNA_END=546 /DNA_ORIENTATION=-
MSHGRGQDLNIHNQSQWEDLVADLLIDDPAFSSEGESRPSGGERGPAAGAGAGARDSKRFPTAGSSSSVSTSDSQKNSGSGGERTAAAAPVTAAREQPKPAQEKPA